MKSRLPLLLSLATLAGCAHVVHMPPGTSVELALAKKPEVLRMPSTPAPLLAQNSSPRVRDLHLPPVEPTLPMNDSVGAVADAYTRGRDALEAGKNSEAINFLKQAVQSDPQFSDAWQQLAVAYEKNGQTDKAKEAYQHSKSTPQ